MEPTTQGITRFWRCYFSEDHAQESQKKEYQKRLIIEGKSEEFWQRMQPNEYSIFKHLEKTPAKILSLGYRNELWVPPKSTIEGT